MKAAPPFESIPCRSCESTGMTKPTPGMANGPCYACQGQGYTLTQRGSRAQARYFDLLSEPPERVRPGHLIKAMAHGKKGMPMVYWARVEAVMFIREPGPEESHYMAFVARNAWAEAHWEHLGLDGPLVRVGCSAARKALAREMAQEYEKTLTPTGNERRQKPRHTAYPN